MIATAAAIVVAIIEFAAGQLLFARMRSRCAKTMPPPHGSMPRALQHSCMPFSVHTAPSTCTIFGTLRPASIELHLVMLCLVRSEGALLPAAGSAALPQPCRRGRRRRLTR